MNDNFLDGEDTFHPAAIEMTRADRERAPLRFQESDEQHAAVRRLAASLFRKWDTNGDGVIDDFHIKGANESFTHAISRVILDDREGGIERQDLEDCMTTLKFGTMHARVRLFCQFLDSDNNDRITLADITPFLKNAPKEMMKKIGFDMDSDLAHARFLEFEDVYSLFVNSDRGEEAISLFCERVLHLLNETTGRATIARSRSRRMSFAMSASASALVAKENLLRVVHKVLHKVSKANMFLIALTALQVGLWVLYFKLHWNDGYPAAYCVAKGFGLNLRVLTILLFLSMARTTMSALYVMKFMRPFLPTGFNIEIHSFCGFCTIVHSFGHMCGHIAYHMTYVDGGFAHSFEQKSLLRGASWSEKGKGDAISGFVLLVSILAMGWTALNRSNSPKAYQRFHLTHYLYNAWLCFLILHVPHLWPYFATIGGLMIAERSYDFFAQTVFSTLGHSRACKNGVTYVSVPRLSAWVYPGSYYRIKVPEISALEWHPFSLAGSVSSNHLTFFVASVGDWTRELHEICADPDRRDEVAIQVQGPFLAPAKSATKIATQRILLVASGIGITPFFSIMATKVSDEQSYEADREVYKALFDEHLDVLGGHGVATRKALHAMGLPSILRRTNTEKVQQSDDDVKELRVVWSIRDASELMFYIDYVYQLVRHQSVLKRCVVHVDIYLTGLGCAKDVTHIVSQTLFLLTISARTNKFMTIHYGRPNLDNTIKEVTPDQVFYCGGRVLKEKLTELCLLNGIPFHPEDFDSGAQFLKETKQTLLKLWKRAAELTTRTDIAGTDSPTIGTMAPRGSTKAGISTPRDSSTGEGAVLGGSGEIGRSARRGSLSAASSDPASRMSLPPVPERELALGNIYGASSGNFGGSGSADIVIGSAKSRLGALVTEERKAGREGHDGVDVEEGKTMGDGSAGNGWPLGASESAYVQLDTDTPLEAGQNTNTGGVRWHDRNSESAVAEHSIEIKGLDGV